MDNQTILDNLKSYFNIEIHYCGEIRNQSEEWVTNYFNYAIQRCEGAALFARMLGLSDTEVNSLYVEYRDRLKNMKENWIKNHR